MRSAHSDEPSRTRLAHPQGSCGTSRSSDARRGVGDKTHSVTPGRKTAATLRPLSGRVKQRVSSFAQNPRSVFEQAVTFGMDCRAVTGAARSEVDVFVQQKARSRADVRRWQRVEQERVHENDVDCSGRILQDPQRNAVHVFDTIAKRVCQASGSPAVQRSWRYGWQCSDARSSAARAPGRGGCFWNH